MVASACVTRVEAPLRSGGLRSAPARRARGLHCTAATGHAPVSRRELAFGSLTAGLLAPTLGGLPAWAADDLSIYDLASTYQGKPRPLSEFKGKVTIVGFDIIGYSCNQFGGQAPESSEGERQWAYRKFECSDCIKVMDKIEVNGANEDAVYKRLKAATRTGDITWNYTKFLVDKDGVARKRLSSPTDPLDFDEDIRLLLAGKDPLPPECAAHPFRPKCLVDKAFGL